MACVLFAVLAGCSGPAPKKSEPAAAAATPQEPGIPIDKIEEIEGWIRFKGWNAAAAQKVVVTASPKEVTIGSGTNGFTVPAADYRSSDKDGGWAEIQVGARLKPTQTPTSVGPAIFDRNTLPTRTEERCGGKPTISVAVWHGCGPVACESTGEIIGVACGGWAANTPK